MTMTDTLTKDDFVKRFIAEMVRLAPFENFDEEDGPPGNGQGGSVREYAEMTAPTYWDDKEQRAEGPQECARSDMSYWGE